MTRNSDFISCIDSCAERRMSEEFNAVNGNGNGNHEALNPIVELLVREGHLTAQQAQYARRVGSRLHMSKPLCDVVRELGYVSDEQIRQTIRRNQGELRIGDLLERPWVS
jgi:type IV pilus assembly protein PilB